jgi:hypothetical protein
MMKRSIYHTLTVGVVVGAVLALSFLCKKATDGFSELSIIHTLDEGSCSLPESLKHLENQTFKYLGKGAQSYAFISEDGQYVIKFLRFDHLLPKLAVRLLNFIPHPYIQSRLQKSQRELSELLTSIRIAQNQLSELTLVEHFQTQSLKKPLTIIDRIGICHKIKNAPFVVQLYATPLNSLIDHLTLEEAKNLINQTILFFNKRSSLSIHDKDPNLLTNFGFYQNRLIEFDIGRFYPIVEPLDTLKHKEQLYQIVEMLWPKLLPKYPELKSYLDSCL